MLKSAHLSSFSAFIFLKNTLDRFFPNALKQIKAISVVRVDISLILGFCLVGFKSAFQPKLIIFKLNLQLFELQPKQHQPKALQ
jgi:hypothetical protein